jgi:tripartite-type tricarboxylate transporter receptor subunit TctC
METVMTKRLGNLLLLFVCLVVFGIANAQNYPSKPVRIIVPYAAGQGTDAIARYFGAQLNKALGQAFIVDNRAGAGGNIGVSMAAHADPDGYTLVMGTNATHSMNKYLYQSIGFDPVKDFSAIILVGELPMVIAASPTFAANSLGELISLAKSKPEKIDVALPSNSSKVVFELLKMRADAPLFSVPYKSSASALTDVIGGQVPLLIDTVTATRAQVASGKLKALAITTRTTSKLMPGVKSVMEQGVPDFEMTAWNALYAPRGTPQPIIDRLNSEMVKILALPETQRFLLELGFEPGGGTARHLEEFSQTDREKWEKVIKSAGIRAE